MKLGKLNMEMLFPGGIHKVLLSKIILCILINIYNSSNMYIHLISFFVISNTKEKKLRSCKFLLFFNQFLHTFMKSLVDHRQFPE